MSSAGEEEEDLGRDDPINVIDDKFLTDAIQSQKPKEGAHIFIPFHEVLQLSLEYRFIPKLESLQQFRALAKLQLNSNNIKKIEGLECLTNLRCLDLSFNDIEKIEGLESQVKLEDLSLYNNKISVIDNMEALKNLQIFSIGMNQVKDLENVEYLRRFPDLHCLNLAGNLVCDILDYKNVIASRLPTLSYLDYRLIDRVSDEAVKGIGEYDLIVSMLRDKEILYEKSLVDPVQLHRDAFVEYLNEDYLYDSIIEDDEEAQKWTEAPGMAGILQTFKFVIHDQCAQIFDTGLHEQEQREAGIQAFYVCLKAAVADNQQIAGQVVTEFELGRKKRMLEMSEVTDDRELEDQRLQFEEEMKLFFDSLMTLEMQLVDQLAGLISELGRKIGEMVDNFTETAQGIFELIREEEKKTNDELTKNVVATVQKVQANELKDLPIDVRMLFKKKETVVAAMEAWHDNRLMKINKREEELTTRIREWLVKFLEGIRDEEVKRTGHRLAEVNTYINYVKGELALIQPKTPATAEQ